MLPANITTVSRGPMVGDIKPAAQIFRAGIDGGRRRGLREWRSVPYITVDEPVG